GAVRDGVVGLLGCWDTALLGGREAQQLSNPAPKHPFPLFLSTYPFPSSDEWSAAPGGPILGGMNRIAAVAFAIALPVAAHAATFTVNSTGDGIDATPGNGICATSGNVCTLRAAIQEA